MVPFAISRNVKDFVLLPGTFQGKLASNLLNKECQEMDNFIFELPSG